MIRTDSLNRKSLQVPGQHVFDSLSIDLRPIPWFLSDTADIVWQLGLGFFFCSFLQFYTACQLITIADFPPFADFRKIWFDGGRGLGTGGVVEITDVYGESKIDDVLCVAVSVQAYRFPLMFLWALWLCSRNFLSFCPSHPSSVWKSNEIRKFSFLENKISHTWYLRSDFERP